MADRLFHQEFLADTAIRVLASAGIGLITAIVAWLLTNSSSFGFEWWFGDQLGVAVRMPDLPWVARLALVLFGGATVVALLLRLLPDGKVSGPPDTLHSLADPDHRVPPKTALLSTLIAGVSTASGASVGLYGPLIHVGSVVADGLRRIIGTDRISWTTLVGCGVAAAISAAFLTPIGAALFATEFVMRRMNLRDFLPLAIASSSAWGASLAFGSAPVFSLGQIDLEITVMSVVATAALGIVLGLVAIGFASALEWCARVASRVPLPRFGPLWAALVLLIVGSFVPAVLGTGIGFVQELFTGSFATWVLVLVLVAKFIATGACVGLRFYGGIFAPSLFVGALAGAIVANLLVGSGLPAFAGMESATQAFPVISAFAVASALVGAPFAAAIMILEMTQSYEIASLGFATCAITSYLYSGFMGRSFFDRRLRDRGLDYEESAPVRRTRTTPVGALAVSLDEIETQLQLQQQQFDLLRAATTDDHGLVANQSEILSLPASMPTLEAMVRMDEVRATVARVQFDRDGQGDERRYLHRERLNELAWELTVTDSQVGILGGLQSRDFVSLLESDLARDLNALELETLQDSGRIRVVHAGERLIRMGDHSRNFFILNAGVVRVSLPLPPTEAMPSDGVEQALAMLRSGAVFGEVSYLSGEPRNADVTAASDCIVQEFRPEFVGEGDAHSDMRRALEKLARRRGVVLRYERAGDTRDQTRDDSSR